MALDVALDIGTAYSRLATAERGVIFNEPTTVAIDTTSAIVVSEPAPSGGGNWIVTISAAAAGTSKNILFKIEG